MFALLVLWLKVMFHYGRAARAEWITQGGEPGTLLGEITYPFRWSFRRMFSRWGLVKTSEKSDYETYTKYTPGVILRFAIFTTALGPVLSFGRLFTEPYNSNLNNSTLILSSVLLFFSMFGGLAHLYVAHRQRPSRWMKIAFWWTIWMLIGPFAMAMIFPHAISRV
jgi:hypothetical protein